MHEENTIKRAYSFKKATGPTLRTSKTAHFFTGPQNQQMPVVAHVYDILGRLVQVPVYFTEEDAVFNRRSTWNFNIPIKHVTEERESTFEYIADKEEVKEKFSLDDNDIFVFFGGEDVTKENILYLPSYMMLKTEKYIFSCTSIIDLFNKATTGDIDDPKLLSMINSCKIVKETSGTHIYDALTWSLKYKNATEEPVTNDSFKEELIMKLQNGSSNAKRSSEYKTISVGLPLTVWKLMQVAKLVYKNNLTSYFQTLLVNDMKEHMSIYREILQSTGLEKELQMSLEKYGVSDLDAEYDKLLNEF